ncbi:HPP family protein [Caulobacter soli]|uniref:HPP family protein n=1 Tax=Caulobacter soli TaxID=2708539 RepID=UPI0013ED42D6|nr:HPP family protein [Caulobacter soli]
MQHTFSQVLRGRNPIRPADILRSGLGALLGIPATGLLAHLITSGHPSALPLLIPPIGASAVLAFAVPASPLAQPRAIIGGNMISALVGVTCALIFHAHPALAAAVAVAFAIIAMSLLGCLHPPGGAVALGAALVAGPIGAASYASVFVPVGLCSTLLVLSAMTYARAVGRSYPHRVAPPPNVHDTRDAPPLQRVGFTAADIDQALAHYGELLDVDREDLDALFREVELQAHRRIHARILCSDIMSRDVLSVDLHQSAESALAYLRRHDLRSAPVIDADRRVVGMVRRAELQTGREGPVEAVLDPFVHKVRPGTAIEALLPILSSGTAHEALVVDEHRVLLGIITQTDLLGVLYRAHIVEAVALQRVQDGGAIDPVI